MVVMVMMMVLLLFVVLVLVLVLVDHGNQRADTVDWMDEFLVQY